MVKHLTVGVAGHIDHGKTALVRALTGTETDRLKEERERGMTIVLGFAHLALPGGDIDLIDVPGHEKFVKTMIAGATGIDAALLVVAANERIKPQTVEHVALMGLLGVKRGIVAVTKSDLVPDPDERRRVTDELRLFLSDTFLQNAPVILCSAVAGEGIDTLKDALGGELAQSETPEICPTFTLPIDRVFTITGQGTIVTGTLHRGIIQAGQIVEILPGGLRAEVRGLQVHGQAVSIARPGGRTAVNLRGVKKDDLAYGDVLATPGTLRPTRMVDVELTLLASVAKPLKRGQSVVLHHGTTELPARVYPLGQLEIAPGDRAFVQMRLSADTAIACDEPFVIRTLSPAGTIGGGRILDPYPLKHTRVDEELLQHVRILASSTPAERFLTKLAEAGPAGRDPAQLLLDLGLRDEVLAQGLPMVRCSPTLALHNGIFETLTAQIVNTVQQFHAKHPTRRGMPSEELRRGLPSALKPAAYAMLLRTLSEASTLETRDGLVRTYGYSPEAALSPIEREIVREIEAQFRAGGLKPPELESVVKRDRRRKTLYFYLVEAGALVPITDHAVFHKDVVAEAVQTLRAALASGEGLTVSQINGALGMTRKFSIPFLEHLDSLGTTRRESNLRFWNEGTDNIER